jgi:hypothetical protein
MRARFRQYMDVLSKTPAPTHGPRRAGCPERRACGVCFSWLLLFAHAKRSDSAAAEADETSRQARLRRENRCAVEDHSGHACPREDQHHSLPHPSGPRAQLVGVRRTANLRFASSPPHPLEGEGDASSITTMQELDPGVRYRRRLCPSSDARRRSTMQHRAVRRGTTRHNGHNGHNRHEHHESIS